MTKHYFLLGAALIVSIAAQAYTHKLTKMYSNVVEDYMEYFYDESNTRLDSIFHYSVYDVEYFIGYKYGYDENGNQTSELGYQKFYGEDTYTNSMQVFYEYDENNRCISRTNYNINNAHTDFELGGVYEYIWEGDLLTQRNMYWNIERTDLYEQVYYTYDENGKLIKEEGYTSFWGDAEYSYGIEYIYDTEGRLTEKKLYSQDWYTGEPSLYGGENYTYDAAGNIVEWINHYGDPTDPSEKRTYIYDDTKAVADVLYPENREWDGFIYQNSQNALSEITVYSTDWNTGEMGVYDIHVHEYSPIETSGVAQIAAPSRGIQVISADGTVYLSGLDDNEMVRIYNSAGQLLNVQNYNPQAGIGINDLPNGIYIISTRQGSSKIVK